MLHPGGADSRAFGPNLAALTPHFTDYLPEQRTHGHTPDVDGPITYELMAADTIQFLERIAGRPARLMGMSDGEVAALLVAKKRPDLVYWRIFVAAPFHHTGWDDGVIVVGSKPPAFMAESYDVDFMTDYDASPDAEAGRNRAEKESREANAIVSQAVMHAAMSWVACCVEKAVDVMPLGGGLFDAEVHVEGGGSMWLRVRLIFEAGPVLTTRIEPIHPQVLLTFV